MALKIGVVHQKGGVGKSTVARLIACEYAGSGWNSRIADMDSKQGTSSEWQRRRLDHGIEPTVSVEQFSRVSRALRIEDNFDLLVFDGAPHATATTLDIARVSDLVILPTGLSLDDLIPTVKLAHELKKHGIDREKIAVALCRVGNSLVEIEEAREYIKVSGYYLLSGVLPERTAYRRASDAGQSATETPYSSLNDKAGRLMQSIVDRLEELTTLAAA